MKVLEVGRRNCSLRETSAVINSDNKGVITPLQNFEIIWFWPPGSFRFFTSIHTPPIVWKNMYVCLQWSYLWCFQCWFKPEESRAVNVIFSLRKRMPFPYYETWTCCFSPCNNSNHDPKPYLQVIFPYFNYPCVSNRSDTVAVSCIIFWIILAFERTILGRASSFSLLGLKICGWNLFWGPLSD